MDAHDEQDSEKFPCYPAQHSYDLRSDAIHGHNNVYKATIFPHNIGLGVTRLGPHWKEVQVKLLLYVFSPGP